MSQRQLLTNVRWWRDGTPVRMQIEDGRVVARGPEVPQAWEGATVVDGLGKRLQPAFIDAHCHILPTGLDLQKLDLSVTTSAEEVLSLVGDRHRAQPEGWLHAVHYDQNRLGGVHLSRHELDSVSSARPILLRHSNGHASVANSAALEAAGVLDAQGADYVRDASGELTGVLLEGAHERVTSAMPPPTLDEMVTAIPAAGERLAAWGVRAASDMMTGRFDLLLELEAYRRAAEQGMEVRTRLYLQWGTVFGKRAVSSEELEAAIQALSPGKTRVAGIKLFADGAIGSATAAVYEPYETGGTGHLIYAPDELVRRVRVAHEAGYAVATHAIGDRATDVVLAAYEASGEPSRHRIEHAMILSNAQIERVKASGCGVSFQPEFLAAFGGSYRRQLGPDRAAALLRTRSLLDAGLPIAFSSDMPIVSGDPGVGIAAATNRPFEACTEEEAIDAYTRTAAWINGDAHTMGSLEPGMWADFVLR